MLSRTVPCPFGEGEIGAPLGAVQNAHPDTVIGSYPKFDGKTYSTDLVIRARSEAALEAAAAAVAAMVETTAASRRDATRTA
jgi:molybdopterin-biosynthesis enzyme MoeA-like protein